MVINGYFKNKSHSLVFMLGLSHSMVINGYFKNNYALHTNPPVHLAFTCFELNSWVENQKQLLADWSCTICWLAHYFSTILTYLALVGSVLKSQLRCLSVQTSPDLCTSVLPDCFLTFHFISFSILMCKCFKFNIGKYLYVFFFECGFCVVPRRLFFHPCLFIILTTVSVCQR